MPSFFRSASRTRKSIIAQPDAIDTPAIPPRSPSRPRVPNKLQKRSRSESTPRSQSHLGVRVSNPENDSSQTCSRGTLGGFCVYGPANFTTERNSRSPASSTWRFRSESKDRAAASSRPELALKVNSSLNIQRKSMIQSPQASQAQYHKRNASSVSSASTTSYSYSPSSPHSQASSIPSTPLWDKDTLSRASSRSSVYSDDDFALPSSTSTNSSTNRTKPLPAVPTGLELGLPLASADLFAAQYRRILSTSATTRKPLPPSYLPSQQQPQQQQRQHISSMLLQAPGSWEPSKSPKPPVPPKHVARGLSMTNIQTLKSGIGSAGATRNNVEKQQQTPPPPPALAVQRQKLGLAKSLDESGLTSTQTRISVRSDEAERKRRTGEWEDWMWYEQAAGAAAAGVGVGVGGVGGRKREEGEMGATMTRRRLRRVGSVDSLRRLSISEHPAFRGGL